MATESRIGSQTPAHRDNRKSFDASMRARQLVASVRQGRRIEIDVLDEGPYQGYLAGWDDDTYFLIVPHEATPDDPKNYWNKLLIPKTNILWIRLIDESTFREEPLFDEMEKIVGPFREALNAQYLR